MPRLHVGLAKHAPMDAITIGGASFQKESWVFDSEGNHSTHDGIKMEFEDQEELDKFEAFWKQDAKHFYFRVNHNAKGELRCDTIDARVPGIRMSKKTDVPVTDFTYSKQIPEEEAELPPTLTSSKAAEQLVSIGKPSSRARRTKTEVSGDDES